LCEESPDDKVEKKKSRTWKLMMELLTEEPNAERSCKVVVCERKKSGMKLPLDNFCKKDVAFNGP
jgi:hypothetical protein